uniref:Putative conserved plasma membrane protein n=1 Tax=Corethrella appendiculata TaxID=1370023 RepID=U5ET33_9DIPT
MGINDAINYALFTNPISSNIGTGLNAGLRAIGLRSKTTSVADKAAVETVKIVTERLPLYQLAGCNRQLIRLAGISGAAAVILGAWGAHHNFERNDDEKEERDPNAIFATANRYHFFHSIALLSVPLARRPMLTGAIMSSGMLLFCGSCYYTAITNDKRFNKLAPTGGLLLILAWISLII